MNYNKEDWLSALGHPSGKLASGKVNLIDKYPCEDFDIELFEQENGQGRHQRVMLAIPNGLTEPAPARCLSNLRISR